MLRGKVERRSHGWEWGGEHSLCGKNESWPCTAPRKEREQCRHRGRAREQLKKGENKANEGCGNGGKSLLGLCHLFFHLRLFVVCGASLTCATIKVPLKFSSREMPLNTLEYTQLEGISRYKYRIMNHNIIPAATQRVAGIGNYST